MEGNIQQSGMFFDNHEVEFPWHVTVGVYF